MYNVFERIKIRFNTTDKRIAKKLSLSIDDYFKVKNGEMPLDEERKNLLRKKYFTNIEKNINKPLKNYEKNASIYLKISLIFSYLIMLCIIVILIKNFTHRISNLDEILLFVFLIPISPIIIIVDGITLIILRKYILSYFYIIPILYLSQFFLLGIECIFHFWIYNNLLVAKNFFTFKCDF